MQIEEAKQLAGEMKAIRLSPWRRWWSKKTIQVVDYDGELIARATVIFDLIGRVLILFGRRVEIRISTGSEEAAIAAIERSARGEMKLISLPPVRALSAAVTNDDEADACDQCGSITDCDCDRNDDPL